MKAAFLRGLMGLLSALALCMPLQGHAQASLAPPQLEQLLAPIALYPDPLLGQILMAATYPLEVVEAARWLQDGNNAALQGEQLAAALQSREWDPSVKSLAAFPQVLLMMNTQLGWTQQLGDAFLAQEAEVMDAVQRLRAQARQAGTLYSTPEAVVSGDGAAISIQPANPQFIYLPSYDPAFIYGAWPYEEYPPYYLFPSYGYAGIRFGYGIGLVMSLWGWDEFDWRARHIRIDERRHRIINRGRGDHPNPGTWTHDPTHRRGVAYRDPGPRQQFLGDAPQSRQAYRGYQQAPAVPAIPAQMRTTPPPSLFGDVEHGQGARQAAERGRASREAVQQRTAPPMPQRAAPQMPQRAAPSMPQGAAPQSHAPAPRQAESAPSHQGNPAGHGGRHEK